RRVPHRRRLRPLLLRSAALCAPLVVLGLTGQAWSETLHPAPRPAPLAYGFQGDFFQTASRPQAIAAIKGAGFGWAKQQVQWSDYQIQASDCAASRDDCLEHAAGGRTKYFRKSRLASLDAVVGDLSGAGL